MSILAFLVLGLIAGAIASFIMKSEGGMLTDLLLGVIGAFVGGFLMNLIGSSGVTGFNLYSLIVSVIGAIVLIAIGRALSPKSGTRPGIRT